MLFDLNTVPLRKKQETELQVTEMNSLSTRKDMIRNEYNRRKAHVRGFGEKFKEARLKWFIHAQKRAIEYISKRMLVFELLGKRYKGRPKRRFMGVMRNDGKVVCLREEDVEDLVRCRRLI